MSIAVLKAFKATLLLTISLSKSLNCIMNISSQNIHNTSLGLAR